MAAPALQVTVYVVVFGEEKDDAAVQGEGAAGAQASWHAEFGQGRRSAL